MDRRRPWAIGCVALVTLALTATSAAAQPAVDRSSIDERVSRLTLGPLLGAVTDRSVRVWVRAAAAAAAQVEYKRSDQAWPGDVTAPVLLDAAHDFAGVVNIAGLDPSTSYDYRPVLDSQVVPAGGTFHTLPVAGSRGRFRFVLGGDLSTAYAPFTILEQVAKTWPDFTILLGDLVYADQPSVPSPVPEAYAASYRDTWQDADFTRLMRTVPSFMMWDDHEIVNDYDQGDGQRYQAARSVYDTYVAEHNPGPVRRGEEYYTFSVADVDFFALDTRSHRSRDDAPDGSGKTLLGPQQKADLKAWLGRSKAPFKVVLSSVAMHDFGATNDAWGAFATERTEILDYIRQQGITGVVVLSGDQHWSSLVRHDPYDVWEFNATPLAQALLPARTTEAPNLLIAYTGSQAFGVVDVDTTAASPTMRFDVVDRGGVVRASYRIGAASSAQNVRDNSTSGT